MFNFFKRKDKRQCPRFFVFLKDDGKEVAGTFMRINSKDWNKNEQVKFIAPNLEINSITEYEIFHAPNHPKLWREATEDEINKLIEGFMKVYKYRYEASHK